MNSTHFLYSLSYSVHACSTKSFLHKHIKSFVQIRVIFNQGSPGWENSTPQVLCIIGMQHWYPFTPLYCIQFINSQIIHWYAEIHVVITRFIESPQIIWLWITNEENSSVYDNIHTGILRQRFNCICNKWNATRQAPSEVQVEMIHWVSQPKPL